MGGGELDDLAAAGSLDELEAAFRPGVARLGFTAYAGGVLAGGDEMSMFLFHWPLAWVKHYAANGYGARDAVVAEALRTTDAFTWTELRARMPDACPDIFAAAAEFGWRDGLAVPVQGPGPERGMVSLAAPRLSLSGAERSHAEALCRAAFERGRSLFSTPTEGTALTVREREALALVASGLDDGAIAAALSISRTTAHSHVERAKTRLGAATRAQAVAIAYRKGILFGAPIAAACLARAAAIAALAG